MVVTGSDSRRTMENKSYCARLTAGDYGLVEFPTGLTESLTGVTASNGDLWK